MSSLIQEINHYRKEVVYSQFFRICFPDDVIYEKITRKQMVELIIQQYTPENIVDVCTVKELKLLKRIVDCIQECQRQSMWILLYVWTEQK